MNRAGLFTVALAGCLLLACSQRADQGGETSSTAAAATGTTSPETLARRALDVGLANRWNGSGICYGAHRDGQGPGGASPTREQLREDLHLLGKHWNLLRMYDAGGVAETVLELIRQERLPMKVMLGVWIATEAKLADGGVIVEEYPQARATNEAEMAAAIRLANAYPDIVAAVSVGNETQVFWSSHKVPTDTLIRYIRYVRARVKAPVTTADDFNYWNKPESRAMDREVDFIVAHIYAMWAGQPLDRALPFTQEKYAEVANLHPDQLIVLGEAGWATQKHNEGEQATLIRGEAGEEQQQRFHDEFVTWATAQRIIHFYFEAFDENWKGGAHPDEVEKNWGLFRADRTPKKAMR